MNWDDMRYVLAISRAAGLSPAAKALGVNPSSVYRRLEALEAELGVRLFERLRSGYRLTEAGEVLAEAAERMEAETQKVERSVVGSDIKLEGHIRLSTSEAFAFYLLPRYLSEFRDAYPGVSLDLSVSNQIVDLSKRDADVVIRATTKPPEHLIGRKLGRIGYAAYATPQFLDHHGRGKPFAAYHWVGFDGPLSHLVQAQWLAGNVPPERQSIRCDSSAAISEAAANHVGCAALPCFAGDADPRLERLPNSLQSTNIFVWILTHPDLRKSARVRACLSFFGSRLADAAPKLLGQNVAG